jgi:hypothetical protein
MNHVDPDEWSWGFDRALRDRVVTFNPCGHTELAEVVKKKAHTLTPAGYDALLTALPAQHRLMVETAINTGLRCLGRGAGRGLNLRHSVAKVLIGRSGFDCPFPGCPS